MDFFEAQREARARAYRIYTSVQRQPTWVTRLSVLVSLLVLVGVVLLLVVPAIVVGVVVFVLGGAVAALRRRIRGLRSPGGPLDARRNVRVITRDPYE